MTFTQLVGVGKFNYAGIILSIIGVFENYAHQLINWHNFENFRAQNCK
jgi:hypothetical protein